MKTLLKIFFTLAVCLVAELTEAQQQNTPTRQVRFYPVRAASDTAATVGNSGRMWYDFISNKFRGNVGGTNFTFGSGGGPSYIFGNGLIAVGDSVVIDSAKVALKSDLGGFITGNILGEQQVTLIDNFIDPVSFGIKIHFEGEPDGYSMFKAGSDLFGIGLISGSPTNGFVQLHSAIGSGQMLISSYDTGPYYHFKFSSSPESYAAQFTDFRATKYGITYADDYSSDFTSRSLIDKGYVDNAIDTLVTVTQMMDSISSAGGGIGGSIANTQIAFGDANGDITGSNNLTWDGSILQNSSNTARIQSIRAQNAIQNSAFFGNTSSGGNAAGVVTVRNNTSTDAFRIAVTSSGYSNTTFESPGANSVNLWSILNGPMRFGTNDTLRYTITANGEHLYPASSYLNMGTTAGSDGYGIRDNAGDMEYKDSGGNWIAFNTLGGGGFTNGAANNELIKSDGTNGVSSGIFSSTNGNIILGSSAITGSRTITVESSSADANLNLTPKGNGVVNTSGNGYQINSSLNNAFYALDNANGSGFTANAFGITFDAVNGAAGHNVTISGNTSKQAAANGGDLTIRGGAAQFTGSGNGGDLILEGGSNNSGSGSPGKVYIRYEGFSIGSIGDTVSLNYLEPISETGTTRTLTADDNRKGIVSSNTLTYTIENLGRTGVRTFVMQDGANTVSLAAGANVVLEGKTATTEDKDIISIWCYKIVGGTAYYICK